MNKNAELLNFVYQNSGMGIITANQILGAIENRRLRRQIKEQQKGYLRFNKDAKSLLKKNGYMARGVSPLQKLSSGLMIKMKTYKDSSPSHIAEIMILGSNMGIIDANRRLNHYKGADRDVRCLMRRLLEFEENNVQRLKRSFYDCSRGA